ncbi:MAG TPA: ATP-binding cassette domain-containing protein [Chitinophagales bacterium]|nr:ATP-binding cassette domain-containing protein [Chitinophagales bacterium]HRP38357.1 ATP-binding cassette domain-containing protein [Chitinophagales bacterium]
MSLLIDCQNLCKTYNIAQNVSKEVKALKNVSFQLNEGDRLGLVGLNGSGKSTLLKILSGIVKPSSGKVELYRKVQNLSGFDSLLQPDLTGRENAVFHLKLNGFKNSEILPNINEILDFSELGTFFELPVKSYSSGMLLRLSFSIFKILKPEILLLDEVFSAGDMRFQKKAEVFFKEYFNKLSGLILASHQLSEIAEYCNKCLVLNKGEVEFLGSVEEAVARYTYSNIMQLTEGSYKTIFHFNTIEFEDKKDKIEYYRNEEITLNLAIEILDNKEKIFPVICIENLFSKAVVACPFFEDTTILNNEQPLGKVDFRVSFPSHTLNYGDYYLSIIWGNPSLVISKMEKVANFKIIPENLQQIDVDLYSTYYPIRPKVKWSIDYAE